MHMDVNVKFFLNPKLVLKRFQVFKFSIYLFTTAWHAGEGGKEAGEPGHQDKPAQIQVN